MKWKTRSVLRSSDTQERPESKQQLRRHNIAEYTQKGPFPHPARVPSDHHQSTTAGLSMWL